MTRYTLQARRSCGLVLVLLLFVASAFAQDDRRLEIRIKGSANEAIYLANYYGNRLFYADTAVTDAEGLAVFTRNGGYRAGVYAVIIGRKRFDVLLNEPVVQLATESSDPLGKLKVVKSVENEVHLVERKAAEALEGADREARLKKIIKEHPGTLAAALIQMGLEPERIAVKRADGSVDSAATNSRLVEHFWDNTDLKDERLPYMPVFQDRLDELIARWLPSDAATVEHYLEDLVSRTSAETKKFVLRWVVEKFGGSETAGLGAVYVRLAQRHVCTAPNMTPGPDWVPAKRWQEVCARVRIKAPLVIGAKSRDLILADTTEKNWVSAQKMPNEFVLIAFWSPHCNHCKQAIPALHDKYKDVLKNLDVGVFAVADARDSALFHDWKAFVREHKLDWVNVGLPWHVYQAAQTQRDRFVPALTTNESLTYPESWEVTGTPKYYLLDRQRKVIAQPTSILQIVELMKERRK